MKTLKIEVTQEHIDSGVVRDCQQCPIAIAIAQHLTHRIVVEVGDSALLTHSETGKLVDVDLPDEADDFICAFDGEDISDPVKPFAFDLDVTNVPPEWLKQESH